MFALAVAAFVALQIIQEDLVAGYELVPAEVM
jgi:hypothetical protein